MRSSFALVSALLLLATADAISRLQTRYSWNAVDYTYPSDLSRQKALQSGAFIPENNLPVGIEVWRNKLFVSVPRWRAGIPATLNYIQTDSTNSVSPRLTPYPSWQGNELGNCANGLSTVYRIKADQCNRLWVLDTGTFGIGNTTTNPCPYAINVYDLNTDRRIRRYELNADDTNANTFIANIAVDIGSSCEDTYAYLSDELGYGLIAYSWEKNKSWRFSHSYFMPDPLLGDFNIAGLNFQWGEEGIFGITLSGMKKDGFRTLYFSPLASHREFAVSTRILRDQNKVGKSYHDFQVLESRAPNSHVTSKVMDDSGIMLFNLVDRNAIGCWNSILPYKAQNHAIVDKDDVDLVFPSDIKVDENKNVWVISDRMPVFLEADLDFSDINFRIFSAPLTDLIAGTVCDQTRPVIEQNNINNNLPIFYNNYLTTQEALNLKTLPDPYLTTPIVETLRTDNDFFTTQSNQPTENDFLGLAKQHSTSYVTRHEAFGPNTRYTNADRVNDLPTYVSTNIPTTQVAGLSSTPWWQKNIYQVYQGI